MTDIEEQKAKLQTSITQTQFSKVIAWALLDIAQSLRDSRPDPGAAITTPFTSDGNPSTRGMFRHPWRPRTDYPCDECGLPQEHGIHQ